EIGQTMGGKMERRRRFSEYWSDTLHDARYALRTLRRDRGFAGVALLILALAVGANISVFSVVNTLLLRPLPFPDSQRLVWIAPPPQTCGFSCSTYSADAYDAFRSLSRSYADVTGYEAFTVENNYSFSLFVPSWAALSRPKKRSKTLIPLSCSPIPTGAASSLPIRCSSAKKSRSTASPPPYLVSCR